MNNPKNAALQGEPVKTDSKRKIRAAIAAIQEAQVELAEEGFESAERAMADARVWANECLLRRCRE